MLLHLSAPDLDQDSLGWLVHKRPPRTQSFPLARAVATVTWGEGASISLSLEPDLDALSPPYVDSRAYRAGEEMSQAIGGVLGSALRGDCARAELLGPHRLDIAVAAVRDGEWIRRCFEPLGWATGTGDRVGEWGTLHLSHSSITLAHALDQLRIGLCVDRLVGWVDEARMSSWLADDWLEEHPHREWILRKLAKGRRELYETPAERLHDRRGVWLVECLLASGARSAVDAGCGRGGLGARLVERGVRVVGLEASATAAERAGRIMPTTVGSIAWFDSRLAGRDAWLLSEVIEHVPMGEVRQWERLVRDVYRPAAVVLSTPNRAYNEVYGIEGLRHRDHRWEWASEEWRAWLDGWAAEGWGYVHGGIGETVLLDEEQQPSFWTVLVRPDWHLPALSEVEDVRVVGSVEPGGGR